jgi:hypothetical protein
VSFHPEPSPYPQQFGKNGKLHPSLHPISQSPYSSALAGGRSSFHQKIPMKRAIFEESGRWKE